MSKLARKQAGIFVYVQMLTTNTIPDNDKGYQ